MSAPRVRFAPSPTGFLHVGSARTALFNWLFARHTGGALVLRIEDTDVERSRAQWSEGILSALDWLGLTADEGPFFQTALHDDHTRAAEALYAGGFLYACDCTREQIDERAQRRGVPGYDGHCRDRAVARSAATALRFRVPDSGETVVHDLIRGDVVFPHATTEDFIAVRSTGVALYPLANLVDDRTMRISHVVRGEDLLPTTPKQVMMWLALNECDGVEAVDLPAYAHLPMLVNEQRKKLSKRRDAVAVEEYRDLGYLPEAFVNYLALLGWSPRGDEVTSREVMVEQFDLADVSASPAFFDVKKLTHVNGDYLRALSPEEFVTRSLPWVAPHLTSWRPSDREALITEAEFDLDLFARVAPLVQTRVATLGEVPGMVEFFFVERVRVDDAAFVKVVTNAAHGRDMLAASATALATMGESEWKADALHEALARVAEAFDTSLAKAQAPLRCAVTGTLVGPPLFESIEVLGRERTLARASDALARAAT